MNKEFYDHIFPVNSHWHIVHTLIGQSDLDAVDEDGWTLLFRAVLCNNEQLVKFLITYSTFDINQPDKRGVTPLKLAIKNRYIPMADFLIQHGAVLYDDILIDCANLESQKFIPYLLSKNANVHVQDNNGMTPLMHYILNDCHHAQNFLIEYKVDVTPVDNKNRNALWYATEKNNFTIVQSLVERCIDVNVADINGVTPLMIAAQYGQVAAVNLLIKNGADIKMIDNKRKNALMYALDNISMLKSKSSEIVDQVEENAKNLIHFIKAV